jgi:hypothetical protein
MAVSERTRNDEGPWTLQAQVPTFGNDAMGSATDSRRPCGKLEPSGMRQTERLLHRGHRAKKRPSGTFGKRRDVSG